MPQTSAGMGAGESTTAEALAGTLFAQYRRRLLAVARHNSDSEEEAEEALQDALTLFVEHFDPGGEAPPLAWLTLTLKRRCWAIYAKRRRRAELLCSGQPMAAFMAAESRSPAEILEAAEEARRLGEAMSALKPDERRALALLALGYTYAEIGELTGWTHTKINRCLAEGRARLRERA